KQADFSTSVRFELAIDGRAEVLERLGSDEHLAVDEERRCRLDAGGKSALLGGPDILVMPPRGIAARETVDVEPELRRPGPEIRVVHAGSSPEERTVIFPELALFTGAARGAGGRERPRVAVERKIAMDETRLRTVRRDDRLHRRLGADAEGALIVEVF